METFKSFEQGLYGVNDSSFNEIALRLFHFQARHNPVYAEYLGHLGKPGKEIGHFREIPFLPISFFKTHTIKTGEWNEEIVFTSSGTTGSAPSNHYVHSLPFYLENAVRSFAHFFGPVKQYHMLALLPSYLEREGSSLVAMVDHFIRESGSVHSGFFLHNQEELIRSILHLKNDRRKVILWGVSFALMDLAERFEVDLSHCIILETGGMKGKRKEITREELHGVLGRRFNAPWIYSEFGMTELLSQAYSTGEGNFRCPPWMKVILRDPEDPLDFAHQPQVGGVNVIDLANLRSCAFIETRDLGRTGQNGNFEVIGRLDNSDVRGCNLLVE